ncbi:hypothetical protein [Streptomyces sp. NPDC088847]|uniref:hypothetical protein n=1 Tax=Streptomyces sp. NPDC088847 TaxID=3365909 RepID=UPI0037FC61E4
MRAAVISGALVKRRGWSAPSDSTRAASGAYGRVATTGAPSTRCTSPAGYGPSSITSTPTSPTRSFNAITLT